MAYPDSLRVLTNQGMAQQNLYMLCSIPISREFSLCEDIFRDYNSCRNRLRLTKKISSSHIRRVYGLCLLGRNISSILVDDNDDKSYSEYAIALLKRIFDRYDILYEGTAIKLMPRINHTMLTIFTVTTQQTTFALAKIAEFNLYGYIMIQTEHSKLFI
jgi:hypothetical protein